ncbi:hypothetical protein RB195_010814 [Necator americanus]|uniref:PHD-finger n=1 Tax=Necator americanus TaxID=51031 RepID=A0ABR1D1V8_NECAM
MTPAAPNFDGFAPKAKFRCVQRRSFGAEPLTMNGIKRAPKLKNIQKKELNPSNSNAESCDDEDTTPKRKRFSPINHRFSSSPSTSNKLHCDNHVEFSDEDAEEVLSSRGCRFSKSGGSTAKPNDHRHVKTECLDEQSNVSGSSDLQTPTKRSFYIVQNDGRPAEMFRTDLLDRLRRGIDTNVDSDDDDVPGCGLIRMTDRWRTEWSDGTQVPLQPNCVYVNEVRKAAVNSRHSGIRRIQQGRRALMKKFLSEPYEELPRESLRLYESTRLDKQWLELLNEQRLEMQRPALTMGMFLEIMNAFEIECYKNIHKKLLEPLHSPSSRLGEFDEEAACDICRAFESEPDDEMVFCDGCNLCVHMSCYGLQVLPPGEWLCMKCRFCFGRNPPCILCPTIGGALKCTDRKNQWAHVVCALWIHECRFGDFEKREPITCIGEIQEERWAAKCSICDTRQGACIKCSVSSCKVFFHVTCALRSGLEMRIEQDSDDDKVHMISLCSRHRSVKIFDSDDAKCDPNQQPGSDEETEEYCISGPLAKLEQTCYQFVDYKQIADRLSLDHLYVSDVFEYWKRKRLDNNGKPLIENLQDEVMIDDPESLQLELPDFFEISNCGTQPASRKGRGRTRNTESNTVVIPSSSCDLKRMTKAVRSWVRLCNSLHKGHDLLGLFLKKIKEERNYVHASGGAALLIAEHISRPVPLSHRIVTYLNESIEGLFTKEVLSYGESLAEDFCCLSEPPSPSASPSMAASSTSSFEPTPSTSSEPCHHSSLTSTSSPRKHRGKLAAGVLPVSSAHSRTSILRPHHPVQESSGRISLSALTEEQNRARKESLRHANVKKDSKSDEKPRECVALIEPSSRILRSTKVAESTTTSHSELVLRKEESGLFINHADVLPPLQSPLPKNVERKTCGRFASRAKTSSESAGTDNRKRLRSSTEKQGTTPKLPKTMKNASRDSTNGLRNIMQNKDDTELSETRTLRSRASLPPMFQVARNVGKATATLTKVDFAQSRIRRHSDDLLQASARTVYAH